MLFFGWNIFLCPSIHPSTNINYIILYQDNKPSSDNMFTRFHDDEFRIKKQLEETTFMGRYQLNRPGNGTQMPFFDDPHIRLQYWGANLTTNNTHLESDLLGLTRKSNRDLVDVNNHQSNAAQTTQITYSRVDPFVEESRASHPAWTYKDQDHTRWETPLINPQHGVDIPFEWNLQTRILEKENFVLKMPTPGIVEPVNFFFKNPVLE